MIRLAVAATKATRPVTPTNNHMLMPYVLDTTMNSIAIVIKN